MCEEAEHDDSLTRSDGIKVPGEWILWFRRCYSNFTFYRLPRKNISAQFFRKACSDFSGKYGSSYRGRLPSFLIPA
jgi:hypothetical protein